MFTCIRVYNNNDRTKDDYSTQEEMNNWVEYNKLYRPGCALFVNGECKQVGYLSMSRCIEIAKELMRQ